MLHCVFAKEIWTAVLQALGKLEWMPMTSSKIEDGCIDKGGTTK